MKKKIIIFSLLALIVGAIGCQKEGINSDTSFLNSAASANPGKIFDISNDNSGNVKITPTGEGVSSYVVKFGHGTGTASQANVNPGFSATHAYPEGSYTVTIISKSLSGTETTATYPLQLTYRAPENVTVTTTTNIHNLKVKATALYAASYLVYFGDVANEVGTPLATGAEVSHDYAAAGIYNVRVVALSGGAATTEKITPVTIYDPFGLPITFDLTTINYFFGTFGGGQQFATVANPNPSGLNMSAKVGKFTRGYESWSGTYSPLNIPIDMAAGKKIRVLAYNPDPALIGKKLNVELESAVSGLANGVAVLKTAFTTSGVWEELVFDFGTIAAIPATEKFRQLVLRFNDGADGAGAVIYVDNFRQTN
ncbi:MAG: putative lipoprotein precursor [Chitinophagaceae bacterium]|nr:putative lipoprotein precursor [Chitinophagaceae bacterium]